MLVNLLFFRCHSNFTFLNCLGRVWESNINEFPPELNKIRLQSLKTLKYTQLSILSSTLSLPSNKCEKIWKTCEGKSLLWHPGYARGHWTEWFVSVFSLLCTCGKKRGVPKVRRYVLNYKSDKNRQMKVQFYENFR